MGGIAEAPPDVGFLAKAVDAAGLGILAFDEVLGRSPLREPQGRGDPSIPLRCLPDRRARRGLAGGARGGQPPTIAGSDASPGRCRSETGSSGSPSTRRPTCSGPSSGTSPRRVRLSTVAEALQLSDSLLGIFTALRHELGNSVNVAKTSLHVLRQGLGRHDEDAVRRYVDRSLEALSRVEAVLGTLRDYGFAPRAAAAAVPVSEVVERAMLECGRCLVERGTALDVEMRGRGHADRRGSRVPRAGPLRPREPGRGEGVCRKERTRPRPGGSPTGHRRDPRLARV